MLVCDVSVIAVVCCLPSHVEVWRQFWHSMCLLWFPEHAYDAEAHPGARSCGEVHHSVYGSGEPSLVY